MKYYVGIDLGTTNSAISSFDGENVRVWKSKKDQNDVTPSAIYIDKRGKRFYGKTAYLKAAQQPDRCATLFKRFMGTSTKIKVGDEELTPEECSAEVLRELYRNLPEEIRESDEVGTVITVPAAFNQMQNAATIEAAKLAGIGNVSLMQEPVAAIMSVMKGHNDDANFLIYDLGGGTLDIAIAESTGGKVNLLAHGGIAMCGGRDFDRIIMNNVVVPWMREHYHLPDDLKSNEGYKKLMRIATYKTEVAKIELSGDESVNIEGETGVEDLDGEEVYLDIELTRDTYDKYINDLVMQSIETTRETIEKSGLMVQDIDRIIFIGGPTNYKPLRDKVVLEVGIPGSIEVNPMTAVSEGASIFAESIDWSTQEHGRKASREQVKSDTALGLGFRYVARTTEPQAKIAIVLEQEVKGYTFEVSSIDTGWSSGSIELRNRATVVVPLNKRGENRFSVVVYDDQGRKVPMEQNEIKISYTLATVGAILASHSIGIEVRENSTSSASVLDYLVREGDTLPAKGQKIFRATENIRAHSSNSINFKLWEGDIESDVEDNRFIGCMKITGDDFDYGMIMAGAEIICDYTVNDAGGIDLEISVPSISESFNSDKNFYSRQEGQVDLDHVAGALNHDGKKVLEKIRSLGEKLGDSEYQEQLQKAGEMASEAINAKQDRFDREELQHMGDNLLKIKRDLNKIRRENLVPIREKELSHLEEFYHDVIENHANPAEKDQFQKLFHTAELAIEREDSEFERMLQEVRYRNYDVLSHSDEFIVHDFERLIADDPYEYIDEDKFYQLKDAGNQAIQQNDIKTLRTVVDYLWSLRRDKREDGMDTAANITRG